MNQKQLIAHLESIIDRKDKRTQAILITGPWGCGKTHAINEVFSDTKYSSIKEIYVSLFGVSRLEDIFDKILIEISTRRKGFKISHIRRIATDFLGEGKKTFEKFGGFASIVQKAIIDNYLDSDSYLVIDDLERASESITAKQLLGFIEAMKERCKVIAIGNIENSSPEMEKEFRQYQERVFDRQYMIDEIDEGIYHSIASRIKAKEIPDYAIEIIINTFAQVFESNLRTFIKIIDEVNDICNFPGVEAILQSREAIQTFSALMIEKHSNGTKIETLEKAMFDKQDNTYRSFISKYDLPNRIGFSIGPFVSCINSKNVDIDAILSVLGLLPKGSLAESFQIATRYWCHSSDEVISALDKLMNSMEEGNIGIFDLTEIAHLFYVNKKVFSILKDNDELCRRETILYRLLEEKCASENASQLEMDIDRIQMSFTNSNEIELLNNILQTANAIRKEKESTEMRELFYSLFNAAKYYQAMRIFSQPDFPVESIPELRELIVAKEMPEELYFAISSIAQNQQAQDAKRYLSHIISNLIMSADDPLLKDRLDTLNNLFKNSNL